MQHLNISEPRDDAQFSPPVERQVMAPHHKVGPLWTDAKKRRHTKFLWSTLAVELSRTLVVVPRC